MDSQSWGMDSLFPGYSIAVELFKRHLGFDLSSYVPFIFILGMIGFAWTYIGEHACRIIKTCFMSTAEIRPDDEIYVSLSHFISHFEKYLLLNMNAERDHVLGRRPTIRVQLKAFHCQHGPQLVGMVSVGVERRP